MRIFKSSTTRLLLLPLVTLAIINAAPSWAAVGDRDTAPPAVTGGIKPSAEPIVLTNANLNSMTKVLQDGIALDEHHKSKRAVLIFFGLPANIHFVGEALNKLAKQYGDKLTVVTVDPAYLSIADELQKTWVQGPPAYPTAVFIGNGTLLNQRGALSGASLEQLATEGMNTGS